MQKFTFLNKSSLLKVSLVIKDTHNTSKKKSKVISTLTFAYLVGGIPVADFATSGGGAGPGPGAGAGARAASVSFESIDNILNGRTSRLVGGKFELKTSLQTVLEGLNAINNSLFEAAKEKTGNDFGFLSGVTNDAVLEQKKVAFLAAMAGATSAEIAKLAIPVNNLISTPPTVENFTMDSTALKYFITTNIQKVINQLFPSNIRFTGVTLTSYDLLNDAGSPLNLIDFGNLKSLDIANDSNMRLSGELSYRPGNNFGTAPKKAQGGFDHYFKYGRGVYTLQLPNEKQKSISIPFCPVSSETYETFKGRDLQDGVAYSPVATTAYDALVKKSFHEKISEDATITLGSAASSVTKKITFLPVVLNDNSISVVNDCIFQNYIVQETIQNFSDYPLNNYFSPVEYFKEHREAAKELEKNELKLLKDEKLKAEKEGGSKK